MSDLVLRAAALALWLLPCVLQDYRTRRVSNWLTVPLFVLAWPVALLTGNLPLTFAVFIGVVVAWRWGGGMGPADGEIAVGLAAFAPTALGIGVLLEMIAFAILRLRGQHGDGIPGVLWFFLGGAFSTVLWSTLAVAGLSTYR